MGRQIGAMHVARIPSRYVSKSGEERRYESVLLRRTFRQEGKVRHETLANLSHLPGEVIALVDAALKGVTLVDAEAAFETERSVPHGDVAAAHVMASKLRLRKLLGPACAERDIAYALILSRGTAGIEIVHRGLVGRGRHDAGNRPGRGGRQHR